MLYILAHFLRDKMPFLWNLIDYVNSFLFTLRYGKVLKTVERYLIRFKEQRGYEVLPINMVNACVLEHFFHLNPKSLIYILSLMLLM